MLKYYCGNWTISGHGQDNNIIPHIYYRCDRDILELIF